jgi:hypothetical protein
MTEAGNMLKSWDGEVSRETMVDGLKRIFNHCLGWDLVRIRTEGPVLTVEGRNTCDDNEHTLVYDAEAGREIYGRVRGILNYEELQTIEEVLCA